MTSNADFWDKNAAGYAKSAISDMDAYNYTLERTRSYLKPSDIALEVGCGTGSTALLLADRVKNLVASDVSPKMIEIGVAKAKEAGVSNIDFVVGDVTDPALGDGVYNVVMAHNLLHLVQDLPTALNRIHQLVAPGGLFISKTICQPVAGTTLKFEVMRRILPLLRLVGLAPFVRIMPIPEFEALIQATGFEILETGNYPAAPPSRYIVARKI